MTANHAPNEIETWFQTEPRYDFQIEMWRCGEDGSVLVVEEHKQPWTGDDEPTSTAVHVLAENHSENPSPRETVVSNATGDKAIERAHEYMRANQEGV
jgi:hypothetical protein